MDEDLANVTLLEAWAKFRDGDAPYCLPEDRPVLESERMASRIVVHRSWQAASRDPQLGDPSDKRLHLGLLPVPFVGDLRTASIYVLLLNPGHVPADYVAEYESEAFRSAAIASIRQKHRRPPAFHMLDPSFAWHPGFTWWNGKLLDVIRAIASRRNVSIAESRAFLAEHLACVELMPYHSPSFSNTGRLLDRLPSVRLAREFVHEQVMARVERDEAIVIVTRQAKAWGVPRHPRVIVYGQGEARGAHLTTRTRGGRAILNRLGF